MPARIQPIGVHLPGFIVAGHRATLAGTLFAWRRRACAIALGRCVNSAFSSGMASGVADNPALRAASYADYLELKGLRSAARFLNVATSDADPPVRPYPIRLWPYSYPRFEPVEDGRDMRFADRGARLGAYLDVIF